MKEKINIIHCAVFTEEIMRYFETIIKGCYADIAFYEVLLGAEQYLEKPYKAFEKNLEFTLDIYKKDLKIIKKNYFKRMKEIKKYELF